MPIIKKISELNERITFFKVMPNPGPEPGETETELFSCWAKVLTTSAKDVKQYSGTGMDNVMEIVIRHQQKHKIDNKMVIEWQGNRYQVEKINPDNSMKEYDVIFVKSSE